MEKTTKFILLVGGLINIVLGTLFGALSAISKEYKLFAGFFVMVVGGLIMLSMRYDNGEEIV